MSSFGNFKKTLAWDFPSHPVVKTSLNVGGAGSIPGRRAEIPYASEPKNQNMKQKQCCSKFNKNFENKLTLHTHTDTGSTKSVRRQKGPFLIKKINNFKMFEYFFNDTVDLERFQAYS